VISKGGRAYAKDRNRQLFRHRQHHQAGQTDRRFADASSGRWEKRGWQDKLAGGFTTSGSTNGDKGECLSSFMTERFAL